MNTVHLFTDGSCLGNPGAGGWAAVLSTEINGKNYYKEVTGGFKEATNQQMEILAAIHGLSAITKRSNVVLYTDSRYLIDGITKWIKDWEKRNWATAAGKPVANKALWQALQEVVKLHEIEWVWVKGHSGVGGNETADRLARKAAMEYK